MSIERFSHLGLCVSDLERALRFWVDGLGFREASRLEVEGEPSETLLGLSPVRLEAVYLVRDGFCLELLDFPEPGSVGEGDARPMNARGLTHLSFRVDDLATAIATLEAAGGRTLKDTRIDNPELGARAVFVLDPDGTRVELVESRHASAGQA